MGTLTNRLGDRGVLFSAVLLLAFAVLPASAQQVGDATLPDVHANEDVTFSRDVAPLIQENCVICHRQGSVAPMSFETYRDARRYARRIKDQVSRRMMPPYHVDTDVGIQQIKGDWRLSDDEISTFVAWVDGGAVEVSHHEDASRGGVLHHTGHETVLAESQVVDHVRTGIPSAAR